ncbi:MAG: TonB-dependent receptor [Planctomycetaceae bacterium]|nr:TonB-dependent receptor [Planctomycetaceae bacterium]
MGKIIGRMLGIVCLSSLSSLIGIVFSADLPVVTEGTVVVPVVQPEYGASLEPQRVVVTATRIPTPLEKVSASVTALTGSRPGDVNAARTVGSMYTAGDIETRQYRSLSDVLQVIPGFSFYNHGSNASSGDYSMRGMGSANTRFLLDGMPLLDPSGTDGHFYLGLNQMDNIGQLEVLRGANSVLWGSNAGAGVVSLTSRKGEGELSGYLSTEAGSRGTVRTRIGAQAGNEKGDFSFGGSLFRTDGFNMNERSNNYADRDGYKFGNANLRLGLNATNCLRFDLFTNYMRTRSDTDSNGYFHSDEKNDIERVMIRPQATLSLFDGNWEQKVGFGYIRNYRHYMKPQTAASDSKYIGETFKFDYQSIIRLTEWNTVLAGLEVETNSMEMKDETTTGWDRQKSGSVTTAAFYLENQINLNDTVFVNAGVRQLHHDDFGDHTVWNASAMYVLPTKTKVKSSVGTAFNAPNLTRLYTDNFSMPSMPYYHNSDLKPERVFSWDAGVEQSLFEDRVTFGSTYFWNKAKDKMDWARDLSRPGTAYTYYNMDDYRAWGFESFLRIAITENVVFSAQHTWLRMKTSEERRHNRLVEMKPKHTASANIDWYINDRGTLTAGVKFIGSRNQRQSDTINRKLASYALFRIGGSWKVNDHIEIFGRVENLFDKKYVMRYSDVGTATRAPSAYGTEGRSFYAGATLSF